MRVSSIFKAIGQDGIIKERGRSGRIGKIIGPAFFKKRFDIEAPQPKPSRKKGLALSPLPRWGLAS